MKTIDQLINELNALSHPENEASHQKFYKAFPGGYGGEDHFLCVKTPQLRSLSKQHYQEISFNDLSFLMMTKVHEYRLIALMMLVLKYQKIKDPSVKEQIVDFYLSHIEWINNWDLVDLSAHYILGDYYFDKNTKVLLDLAKSQHLWKERIAIISSFAFIRKNNYELTLKLAKMHINHKHDLIHKAVGWMLREIGKRDIAVELSFLDAHTTQMPRTMLRYAIEKFPEELRLKYLKMKKE